MSEATTGVAHANARVSTIPKLSPPREGATSAFAARSSCGERVLRQEAEHVDALVGHAKAREQQAHRQRVGPDDAQPRTRAPADLRPRAEEHLQALARLLPADEDDLLLTAAGLGLLRDEDAVRDQLVVARGSTGPPISRAGSETAIRWSIRSARKPQTGLASLSHDSSPRRVERRDDRTAGQRERRHAGRRRHRLVDVDQVELLALEDAPASGTPTSG